jgi:hypothetical protein
MESYLTICSRGMRQIAAELLSTAIMKNNTRNDKSKMARKSWKRAEIFMMVRKLIAW